MAFHEVRFPTGIAFGSKGGPERRTIVVTAGSGAEHRNSQWANSKRRYNAGYGVKSDQDIYTIIDFFEDRRGRLHGFRWKDRFDFKSRGPRDAVTATDQQIGVGDGVETQFQLSKTYGTSSPYVRAIKKTVTGTVKVSLDDVEQMAGWTVDDTTGIITFSVAPGNGVIIKAGFEFDVPVRFDTDYLEINMAAFAAGQIPDIPIVELSEAEL